MASSCGIFTVTYSLWHLCPSWSRVIGSHIYEWSVALEAVVRSPAFASFLLLWFIADVHVTPCQVMQYLFVFSRQDYPPVCSHTLSATAGIAFSCLPLPFWSTKQHPFHRLSVLSSTEIGPSANFDLSNHTHPRLGGATPIHRYALQHPTASSGRNGSRNRRTSEHLTHEIGPQHVHPAVFGWHEDLCIPIAIQVCQDRTADSA